MADSEFKKKVEEKVEKLVENVDGENEKLAIWLMAEDLIREKTDKWREVITIVFLLGKFWKLMFIVILENGFSNKLSEAVFCGKTRKR